MEAVSAVTDANVSLIAHIIQLAVAPVFLLAGIGSVLNVLAHRLARVVDHARRIEARVPEETGAMRAADIKALAVLDRRMAYTHWAIGLCTTAALLICLVVVVLFVADLVAINFAIPVSVLFILAMISLTMGLLLFLAEVTVATRHVRVSEQFVLKGRPRNE
ncbi:DUF2721 domain-containing protein [Allosphingosinicella flava]|uniref:DUF2721 domain-containing protein n=1 Tax=Allosphingosinicella flava TaxID=2771430 RepID=A0A7T2GJA9_9SPHN|nr:DUF2721 domain-containing protein [Sphingosinicella flava]QPQ54900.1 DUF2721 domain-containing protein [Sphingosinicella flava]